NSRDYQGELPAAVRVNHTNIDDAVEIDNVWAFGWGYSAFSLYRGFVYLHHFRAGYTWRQGFGYSVWPGRDANNTDGIETLQHVLAGQLHNFRHALDGIGQSFDPVTLDPIGQTRNVQERLIFSGENRYTTVNTHSTTGPFPYTRGYGAHV